jgi:rhamnose utilization protein RhaD (predicted bifunctional aldolase and dehydrogenase)
MMMLKTEYYYRNPRGIYRSRLINYLGFWVLALNLFLAVISLVHAFLSFDFIASIHAAALLASTRGWLAVQVVNRVYSHGCAQLFLPRQEAYRCS